MIMEEKEEYYSTNNVAGIIKGIAIFLAMLGVIGSIILGGKIDDLIVVIVGIFSSILSAVLLYAIGELIQIMHDIRTNSEHIRDYIERNK